MAYRGIGDAATAVIESQNRLGMQAAGLSEQARQFDENKKAQEQSRLEQARQFDVAASQRERGMAEDRRQFEAGLGQRERGMAEDRRQFDVGAAQRERGMAEGARQFDVEQARASAKDEFNMALDAMTAQADMESKDAETRKKLLQLREYTAAADEEQKQRRNRENMAKGAFGGLVTAAMRNNGVIPANVLEIANRELGDQNNRIVGGGIDEASGIAFFDVQGPDGQVKQLKMRPENQYALMQTLYGDQGAEMFATTYKNNASVLAAIERKREELGIKRVEALGKAAGSLSERIAKLTEKNFGQNARELEALKKRESIYNAALDKELGVPTEPPEAPAPANPNDRLTAIVEPGTKVLKADIAKKYNLPPGTQVRADSKGRIFAYKMVGGHMTPIRLTD